MKKLFALLFAALMVVCALPVSVAAADAVDTFTVSAQDTAEVGETFTVDVTYEAVKGIGSLELALAFDKAVLEVVSVDVTGAVVTVVEPNVDSANQNGEVAFVYAGLANVTNSGKIGAVTFKVLDDAKRGETALTLSDTSFYYEGQDSIDLNATLVNDTVAVPLKNFEGITFENATVTYDGAAHPLAVTGDTTGATVEYSNNEQTAVGTHTVTAKITREEYNDLTLTATLTVNKADITLDALDVDNSTATLTGVVAGEEVDLDYSKITVAYDADKWVATGFELIGEAADNYTLTTDEIEVAVAEENITTVTVTNALEDSEGDPTTVDYKFYKGAVTVTAATVKGYKFEGWYDGETLLSVDETYTFTADADVALTAKYSEKKTTNIGSIVAVAVAKNRKYTVTFNTMGGNLIDAQTVKSGNTAVMPVEPTKAGYNFAGWYTDTSYTVKYDFATEITKDTFVFAKWTTLNNRIVMTIDSTDASVFGEAAKTDVAPIIAKDRTMLPARFVAENLGATVTWDAAARRVTISGKNVTIVLVIDSATAYVNGDAVTLDSPAFIQNDRTYTPVRFIAETLGATVEWDATTRQVTLIK